MTTATNDRLIAARCGIAASEIAALANSGIAEQTFARGVLDKVVEALGAEAAAFWSLSPQGVLNLAGEVRLAETGVTRDPVKSRQNVRRLLDVTGNGQPALHDDPPLAGDDSTASLVAMAPVSARDRCQGVVEVFLKGTLSSPDRTTALQFVEEVCSSIAHFFKWRAEERSTSGNLEFSNRFDQAVARLHASLDPRQVAMTAVNEGRALLGCDRLSLVVERGRKAEVLAVSGQERVNRSSNLIRSLTELANLAIRNNLPVGTDDDSGGLPPAIEQLLVDYLKTGGLRMIKVLPLQVPQRPASTSTGKERPAPPARAFAALAIEQFSESWHSPLAAERAARYAVHVATAMNNALSHERVFLLPMARAIGRCWAWLAGRPLMKLIGAAVLIAGTVLTLACIPARYRVEGKGKLMPVVQRNVFAPFDGEVIAVHVAGGDRVEAGQLLVQLRNDELQSQLLAARNRQAEKQQQYDALQAEIGEGNRRASQNDELLRLRGRLAQTRIELEGAAERVAALEKQADQLKIHAPIAGTVASFQVEQSLLNRPVRRGEVLLEVMDESDAWHLEISVPEHRLGHMFSAVHLQSDRPLDAEFVLATTPEETLVGEVSLVSTRTDVSQDQGAVVDVHVAIDAAKIRHRRIGAEAVAKIDCGERSLGYVLFGDAVEFVRRRIW